MIDKQFRGATAEFGVGDDPAALLEIFQGRLETLVLFEPFELGTSKFDIPAQSGDCRPSPKGLERILRSDLIQYLQLFVIKMAEMGDE